jgi:hypothetical protein
MAANAKKQGTVMANDTGLSSKLVNQALEAVASKDAKAALDLMKQILAQLLGGSPDESAPADDAGGDAPPMDPASAAASLTAASLTAKEFVSAARLSLSLTGLSDVGSAMAELKRTHKLAKDLESREAQLKADREVVDAAEYVSLTAALVKAGKIAPFLAWDEGQDGRKPSAHDEVDAARGPPRARRKARRLEAEDAGTAQGRECRSSAEPDGLTEEQIRICKETGCDPQMFAMLKGQRDSVTKGV